MFRKLIVENYKSWAGLHIVELAPLTLIYGPNSSGKSSLLQPLLLLKQTFEAPRLNIHLNLGGHQDLVSVGTLDLLIHQPPQSTSLPRASEVVFGCAFDKFRGMPEASDLISPVINYQVAFREMAGIAVVSHLEMSTGVMELGPLHWVLDRNANGTYELEHPVFEGDELRQEKTSAKEPERAIPYLGRMGPPLDVFDPENGMEVSLVSAFESLRYVGPVRLPPQRSYRPSEIEAGAGARGEHALVSLLRGGLGEKGIALLGKWVRELGLGDEVSISKIETDTFRILVHREGVAANLADVGYGVGQVLPVIASILQPSDPFSPDPILIIEEPESHLHPAAQAELGDLLVEAVTTGFGETPDRRQLIIETHSEQLLQRIQRRMAEGKLTPEQVAIYRCSRGDDGASRLDRLVLDEYGFIKEWPENFFGDPLKDSAEQMRAMLKRIGGNKHG